MVMIGAPSYCSVTLSRFRNFNNIKQIAPSPSVIFVDVKRIAAGIPRKFLWDIVPPNVSNIPDELKKKYKSTILSKEHFREHMQHFRPIHTKLTRAHRETLRYNVMFYRIRNLGFGVDEFARDCICYACRNFRSKPNTGYR